MPTFTEHPRCPRCGYDLRGPIAEWTSQCPVEGACSECGLQFLWRDIFYPTWSPPIHIIEFAPRRHILVSAWFTIVSSFAAPWFWRRVRLQHPYRPKRLAAYALIALVMAYLFFVVQMVRRTYHLDQALSRGMNVTVIALHPDGKVTRPSTGTFYVPDGQVGLRLLHAAAVPWSNHAFTAMVQTPLPVGGFLPAFPRRQVVISSPAGAAVTPPKTLPYLSPRDIFTELRNELFGRSMRAWAVCAFPVVLSLAMIPFFALLPQTRRQCKVRFDHICRIGIYSAVLAFGMSMAFAFLREAFQFRGSVTLEYAEYSGLWGAVIMPIFLALWWTFAIRNYLRMPHAGAVATTAVTLSSLAILLTGFVFPMWYAFSGL